MLLPLSSPFLIKVGIFIPTFIVIASCCAASVGRLVRPVVNDVREEPLHGVGVLGGEHLALSNAQLAGIVIERACKDLKALTQTLLGIGHEVADVLRHLVAELSQRDCAIVDVQLAPLANEGSVADSLNLLSHPRAPRPAVGGQLLRRCKLAHIDRAADEHHAAGFTDLRNCGGAQVNANQVAALIDQGVGADRISGGIIEGVCPQGNDLRIGVGLGNTDSKAIELLDGVRERNTGNVADLIDLRHLAGEEAGHIAALLELGNIDGHVLRRLVAGAIELKRFSVNGDSPNKKHYTLSNDDYVWEVLAGCENAPFVEDEKWVAHDREYYSFTITSETLGVYKVAMYVTVDGYLWTNAFNYQYLFNIGEDAASKIIKYAKENSTEAEYEPYQNTIVGKITEITDEYILLDDSILCANPDDGITYKILLNDLRISRYAESGAIRVGENVQITYEGEIDESNTIDSAISASDVVISGGDVLIPE